MRDAMMELFDEEDNRFVEQMQTLGMSRKAARVFTFLCQRTSGTSREIEKAAKLHQPEVSVGIQELLSWLAVEKVESRYTKSRATARYSLSVPWKVVVEHYYRLSCMQFDRVNAIYAELVK